MDKGLGCVDARLLADVALAMDITMWTNDRRLRQGAEKPRLAYARDAEIRLYRARQ